MNEFFLPSDIARCDNDKCKIRTKCARWLDILPTDKYWYSEFTDDDCNYFIEKEGVEPIKNKRT